MNEEKPVGRSQSFQDMLEAGRILAAIKKHSRVLAREIGPTMDLESLSGILSLLETIKKKGLDEAPRHIFIGLFMMPGPRKSSEVLSNALSKEKVRRNAHMFLPLAREMAEAGQNPNSIIRAASEHLDEWDDGTFNRVATHLLETARSGHDPEPLQRVLSAMVSDRDMGEEEFKRRAGHVRRVLEATKERGYSARNLAGLFVKNMGHQIRETNIDASNMTGLLSHLESHMGSHDPNELMESALAARRKGVGFNEVIACQNRFIKKGHFPTGEQVVEYHNRFRRKGK